MAQRILRTGRALALVSVLALGVLPVASSTAQASGQASGEGVAAPSDGVTVDVLAVNGSGCPAGSAAVRMSSDNTGFVVTYSGFVARVGPNQDATDRRKNCQLGVQVNVPSGFTYAVARADYVGTAQLAAGATGLERSNYYFQGSSDDTYVDHSFTGPLSGRWQTSDATSASALVYAPCGDSRVLNINTELRVDDGSSAASATSSLAMTASGGGVNTLYHLSWKYCG